MLAKTGILNNKKATIYTSSGVSASIDMALAFIADNYGVGKAAGITKGIEYIWNKDSENDIFSSLY